MDIAVNRKASFCTLLFVFSILWLRAQGPCDEYAAGYFGLANDDLESASLVVIPNAGGFYLGGVKNDSALIIRFDTSGQILWARTFDVVPNLKDNISSLILDSDQMLIIGGTNGQIGVGAGGPVFILKYDPNLNQVLWTQQFIPNVDRSYCWSIIELSPGGNYLMSNDPVDDSTPNVDAELLEISRSTGLPVTGKNKIIHLGGSEDITNMIIYQGAIYGTGRFTDGLPNNKMRTALIKMDVDDRDIQWVKLGHRPGSQSARLYGVDLAISNNFIYVCSIGDPSGTSSTNTKSYIQKFTLDGNLIWLNEYDFPGNNDWGYEMISQPDGLVIHGVQKAAPQQFILYKIDFDGNLVWANSFPVGASINPLSPLIGDSQLIQMGDKYVFTGYTATQIIVIMTDLEGKPLSPCIPYHSISFPVNPISTAAFYAASPIVSIPGFTTQTHFINPATTNVHVDPLCITQAEITTNLTLTICEGDAVEGYAHSGIYQDTFLSVFGCDSIRTLNLAVVDLIQSNVEMTICPGDLYMGYGTTGTYQDTFLSHNGCDSVRILHLHVEDVIQNELSITICTGGQYMGYSNPGIYQDTFISVQGCDSIRILKLDVRTSISTNLSSVICEGEAYFGYTATGMYQDTFTSYQGCDSIRTLDLLVANMDETYLSLSICEGESIDGYNQTGVYQDTFVNIHGCDSIRTLQLEVRDTIHNQFSLTLCMGDQYAGYELSGFYQDTFISVLGCDSIRSLALTMVEVFFTKEVVTICLGEQYMGYNASGNYVDTLLNINGCDSIRDLDLKVLSPQNTFDQIGICEAAALQHYSPGIYQDTFLSIAGCDSISTVQVENGDFYVPNIFSPNGDGVNDVFEIVQSLYADTKLVYFALFDRYGNMAYETYSWPVKWNGANKKGMLYNPGVFTYVLKYTCGDPLLTEHGNVTLVR